MSSTEIALVTGANKGIGRQIAAQLGAKGMTVVLTGRNAGLVEAAAAELGGYPVVMDVTDEASVRAAAAQVADRFGRLDVLVNNAAIAGDFDGQMDLAVVREVFETNVFGVITVTNTFIPLLKKAPAARIVNVSSSVGSMSGMNVPGSHLWNLIPTLAYGPSKTALNSLTVQYAKALRSDGILVNSADPGACDTDFTRGRFTVTRTAADGAAIVVHLATLGQGGPSGRAFNDNGELAW